jgi:hypothetical protein
MDFAIGEERQIAGSVITSRKGVRRDRRLGRGGWVLPDAGVRGHPPPARRGHEGETTFTFVTEGIGAAIEQATVAAEDKLVHIMGGASIIQQALAAGLVDDLFLHVAPVILNSGTRLFEHLGGPIQLERAELIESPHATHLRYRILK